MALAKITWQGLTTIGILVAALWGCFVAEHLIIRRAQIETWQALRSSHSLRIQRHIEPASVPVRVSRPARPAVG